MELESGVKKEDISMSLFLDWDKYKNCFYNNLYLEDYKLVIKIPLLSEQRDKKDEIKIKKFSLTKYTYLVSYD